MLNQVGGVSHQTRSDYGGHRSSVPHRAVVVRELAQLQNLMRGASEHRQSVRIRANAHSMNGLSIPRTHEILLLMHECCHCRRDNEHAIMVGAGAAVWDVHALLMRYGHGLLVYNDGGAAASSLGGYLSAGGFGQSSARHGGFWESVLSVKLVDGLGNIHDIDRNDPRFPWLFGSMGQLGVVYELTLRTQPARSTSATSMPGQGRIARSHHSWEPILWHTLFVPQAEWKIARERLIRIGVKHRAAWRGRWPYAYAIPFKTFNPPLIHPHQDDLAAVGIWGDPHRDGFNWSIIHQMRADITELVAENPQYRRYIQTEFTPKGFEYADYFGKAVFGQFLELKQVMDPVGVLSVGVF